ncbi:MULTISPECIES: response regulator [unclassified Leeuwenhoekiella]|uniref:response regulator n=1 Tax=unclassified Leeuwenhoekiella TaxID=2615029 RepID=UPI000C510C67|nr:MULTISPECIES: response regulator [unclassified Leeuwenhoekiella]MAW95248.1 hypothetical protein [Leeuwenhoekiella sp.]MBA81829.1 hypothetical protein [Leeuwenhoekiella sp.]|tara:strand:- start:12091 stop:14157 length:2067 start_codon:yes stop_codon:yes gene_type:complete
MTTPKLSIKSYWIAGVFFLVPLIICLTLYSYVQNQLPQRLSNQIQLSGSLASQDFKRTVEKNVEALHDITERIEETEGLYFQYWKEDAVRLLKQSASLEFVEFINRNGIIEDVVPFAKNRAAQGLDITKLDWRYGDWQRTATTDDVNITHWTSLTQGGFSFLIDIPVYYNGSFQGTITGGMNFNEEFNRLSSYLNDYAIKIEDEEGTRFYDYNNYDLAQKNKQYIFESNLVLDADLDESWNFELTFANPDVIVQSSRIADYALICGIILALAIGLLKFFNSKARHATKIALKANKNLTILNQELQQQTEIAQNAAQAKATFLSNMSHEIRTPLNAIVGIADLMDSEPEKAQDPRYKALLRDNSKKLLGLINDLLRMDKLESGSAEVYSVEFSPASVIENITSFHRKRIEEKGLDFNVNIETKSKSFINGDRGKFEQIVGNILLNAIKFTQSGSISLIYKEYEEDKKLFTTISIKDTGIGIPKDKLSTIFDRFTQLDTGIRKKHAGGGLGLAIAAKLIELMGGSIEVDSDEGKGSDFVIHLTFKDLHKKEEIKLNSKLVADLPPLEVLIVDDNKLNVIILTELLKRLGLSSDSAKNGMDAVNKCNSKSFDLIFMDVHMPEMDGFEATRKIKEEQPDVVVLGLSADTTSLSISEGLESGMDNYLTKPIDKGKLIAILKEKFKKPSPRKAI